MTCSFCSKSRKDVTKMIVGAKKTSICNECVKLCVEILEEDIVKARKEQLYAGDKEILNPVLIKDKSGNNNSLQVYGNPEYKTGPYGRTIEMDGTEDYLGSTTDIGLMKTIAFWMKLGTNASHYGIGSKALSNENAVIEYTNRYYNSSRGFSPFPSLLYVPRFP